MAKSNNLPAKKYKAGERTERTLRFVWNAGDGQSTNVVYLDIAKALSALNRRFYRQGLYYYISGGYFINGSVAHMQINTLPDTYQTKLAWQRGFKVWSKMNRDATFSDTASIYPAYHDFKTQYLNGVTVIDPMYGSIDSDYTDAAQHYTGDEWVTSKFVSEDPPSNDPQANDDFVSHMLGPHVGSDNAWTSVGLIRSLQDTWAYPPAAGEPSLDADADTDPLANLFDAGETAGEIRLNLDQDNDLAPYDANMMTGSGSALEGTPAIVCRTSSGSGAKMTFGGFCAPIGLLQIQTTDFGDGSSSIGLVELVLELTPGPYHGVYAERVI